jgi:hypothetical protein
MREAIMTFVEQLSAIALLVDFLFGVTLGVIGSASLASRREDWHYSLTHAPPDSICDGARILYGVYTCGDGWVADARRDAKRDVAPVDDGGNGGSGAQGQEPNR